MVHLVRDMGELSLLKNNCKSTKYKNMWICATNSIAYPVDPCVKCVSGVIDINTNNIINLSKCKHGEYTNKFFGKECKKCGSPKTVMCDIEADGRVSHSSKKCNPVKCDKFKPQTADK